MAIVVEGQRPYTGGTGVEIDGNKVISVLLREENNLILVNNDNELYTDLQLADGIEPDDDLPVGVTVGKVLEDDGWEQNGLLLNWKTTSGDYARWIYGADGKIYFDGGTGERSQVYYSSEVDDLFTALRNSLANVAFTGDYNDLINRPTLPVVYDGTLTIQKNGTTVGDFTANQQANETINITVPVNTSDLNNDSGFIDKNVNDLTYYTATADLATVATTGDYDDLIDKPNLATVATTGDYDDLLDKPNLATVATSGDYNDLTNKPTIPAAQVQSNWTESDNTKVDYIKNKPNLATVATSGSYSDLSNTPNLATVATSGSYADLSNKPTIPSVLDSVSSTSTTDALSANQGKNLQDQINDLKAMGKFLSLWNASTGQPISFPHSTPYTYSTGDYYLVETVSTANPPANKRPSGSSYTGAASTTAETDELEIGDLYIYDGSVWLLQINHGKTVSFANLAGQPTDNAAGATALGAKADTSSLATVATTGSYSDLSNKPTIPAAQVQSNWTESDNTKVEYIKNKPTLATVATSGAYSDLSGTPNLATVATSGSYSDLSNKPTIPAAQVNSDWDASSGVAQILNKPTIPTVNNATLTITQNGTSVGTFTANASSNVTIATTDTTYQSKSAASGGTAVSLVTTGEKYTWNNKQDAISNLSTIESGAAAGATAVQPGDLATVATTGSYSDLSNKPTIPSVYDATITFTQGGTSKGDITLNQSSNETIALDAGFTPGGTATTGYVVTKTANGYEWAAPSGGHDYSWNTLTGTSFTLSGTNYRNLISTSSDTTVSVGTGLTPGMEYIIRITNSDSDNDHTMTFNSVAYIIPKSGTVTYKWLALTATTVEFEGPRYVYSMPATPEEGFIYYVIPEPEQPRTPGANTLVYYKINDNDTSSTIYDLSGNSNDQTWYNTASYNTDATYGRVATFNGNNYTQGGSIINFGNAYTVITLVKFSSTTTGQTLVNQCQASGKWPWCLDYGAAKGENKFEGIFSGTNNLDNSIVLSQAYTITIGQRVMLAMTRASDNTAKIYINGVLNNTASNLNSPSYSSGSNFGFGQRGNQGNLRFNGDMKLVIGEDRTWTDQEIADLAREYGFTVS